ncbi:restriction endonuclease-like protein [Neobacillus novalis]|uniref:Restriction endonuclease-like protein n=1 Tax=Neobacillus novalis TaxID=220687 RepID=A0AA95MN62_9BACI|nr:restriction endonuclease-like protein [Neobacillus novalis]WHY87067.1 restriction endonuclease-like protein [Neobacillus novalis]
MVSLPSGSRDDVELAKIDATDFSLVIKGKPYHHRYEGLKQYRKMDYHDVMEFDVTGSSVEAVQVYDIEHGELTVEQKVRPIFFENGIYQLIVVPKQNQQLEFYHEYPMFREAISKVELAGIPVLMGNLQFQNEVGYSTFEIRNEGRKLLEVTLEIFPAKLDYQNDYKRLLNEVNDEIYNLAFHFIRKTYLGARIKLDGNPSRAEFYRLITEHFQQFIQTINRIEQQPHHKLETTYVKVRGDQLSKPDTNTKKYLQKKSQFVDVTHGIPIHGRTLMPLEGIKAKKELVYDTLENRYVKWMMQRLDDKLADLISTLNNQNKRWKIEPDSELMERLSKMKETLESRRKNHFWRKIGRLDRSVMSLVLQMAPGYREAFQIFIIVSKGLMLQSRFYQMSVKDVATIYEYWTFLKLGQILSRKYTMLSQDIIKVNREGLFVNLDSNQKAERKFEHPITKEKITLTYQKYEGGLPTISQKPDTMLTISKKGRDYSFNYVFDAKYRVDYAQKDSSYENRYQYPGPLEEDINTMHRYRDSIVAMSDMNNGPYERTAFGAYVLFPWGDQDGYREHPLYKSINQVNIGGLPFLPQATDLVEQFVERLIEKSPEEIQREGILPRGIKEEWESSLVEKVLVGTVSNVEDYNAFIQSRYFRIPVDHLNKGWQEAKYVALYTTVDVGNRNGIAEYGEIEQISTEGGAVRFHVKSWQPTKQLIKPVKYGIATYMMTTLTQLNDAKELPELYMKNKQETTIWRMLRRISDRITIRLNEQSLDVVSAVETFSNNNIEIQLNKEEQTLSIRQGEEERIISSKILTQQPSLVFKEVLSIIEKD